MKAWVVDGREVGVCYGRVGVGFILTYRQPHPSSFHTKSMRYWCIFFFFFFENVVPFICFHRPLQLEKLSWLVHLHCPHRSQPPPASTTHTLLHTYSINATRHSYTAFPPHPPPFFLMQIASLTEIHFGLLTLLLFSSPSLKFIQFKSFVQIC